MTAPPQPPPPPPPREPRIRLGLLHPSMTDAEIEAVLDRLYEGVTGGRPG